MWFGIIFIIAISTSSTIGNLLDLSWNGLTKEKFFTDLNGSVTDAVEKATELNLAGNLFDNFVDCSAKLDNLEILDLSRNKLERFYFSCQDNNNLYKLNVSHNKLRFLNDTALSRHLTKLRILDLSDNIVELVTHQTFQHLEKLHFLALNANPIGNKIHTDAFKGLKSLVDLNLGDISASNFPPDLFTPLVKLRHLTLASNPLITLPVLPTSIEKLDISSTRIILLRNLDTPNLLILTMNFMPRLESIDFNQFEKVKKLAVLSAANSPRLRTLTALPTRTDLLLDLKRIYVRNCSIDKLGLALMSIMQRTTVVDLQDNPWHCDCGTKWILGLNSTINYRDHMWCETPQELHNRWFYGISTDEFECEGINYLGLWLTLGVFALIGCLIAIFYFATEPIKRKWKTRSNHVDMVTYKNIITDQNDTDKILDHADITD